MCIHQKPPSQHLKDLNVKVNFSLVKGEMVAQQPCGCENSMTYMHNKEIVFH